MMSFARTGPPMLCQSAPLAETSKAERIKVRRIALRTAKILNFFEIKIGAKIVPRKVATAKEISGLASGKSSFKNSRGIRKKSVRNILATQRKECVVVLVLGNFVTAEK
jgi:hypothetical protein